MRNDLLLLPSAVLGLACVGIYAVRCLRRRRSFNVAMTVTLILQSAGVVAGCLLIASVFSETIKTHLAGIELYVLIAGVSVLVVSLQGLFRDLGAKNSEPPTS